MQQLNLKKDDDTDKSEEETTGNRFLDERIKKALFDVVFSESSRSQEFSAQTVKDASRYGHFDKILNVITRPLEDVGVYHNITYYCAIGDLAKIKETIAENNKYFQEYMQQDFKLDIFYNLPVRIAMAQGHLHVVKYLLSFAEVDPCDCQCNVFEATLNNGHIELLKEVMLSNPKRFVQTLVDQCPEFVGKLLINSEYALLGDIIRQNDTEGLLREQVAFFTPGYNFIRDNAASTKAKEAEEKHSKATLNKKL